MRRETIKSLFIALSITLLSSSAIAETCEDVYKYLEYELIKILKSESTKKKIQQANNEIGDVPIDLEKFFMLDQLRNMKEDDSKLNMGELLKFISSNDFNSGRLIDKIYIEIFEAVKSKIDTRSLEACSLKQKNILENDQKNLISFYGECANQQLTLAGENEDNVKNVLTAIALNFKVKDLKDSMLKDLDINYCNYKVVGDKVMAKIEYLVPESLKKEEVNFYFENANNNHKAVLRVDDERPFYKFFPDQVNHSLILDRSALVDGNLKVKVLPKGFIDGIKIRGDNAAVDAEGNITLSGCYDKADQDINYTGPKLTFTCNEDDSVNVNVEVPQHLKQDFDKSKLGNQLLIKSINGKNQSLNIGNPKQLDSKLSISPKSENKILLKPMSKHSLMHIEAVNNKGLQFKIRQLPDSLQEVTLPENFCDKEQAQELNLGTSDGQPVEPKPANPTPEVVVTTPDPSEKPATLPTEDPGSCEGYWNQSGAEGEKCIEEGVACEITLDGETITGKVVGKECIKEETEKEKTPDAQSGSKYTDKNFEVQASCVVEDKKKEVVFDFNQNFAKEQEFLIDLTKNVLAEKDLINWGDTDGKLNTSDFSLKIIDLNQVPAQEFCSGIYQVKEGDNGETIRVDTDKDTDGIQSKTSCTVTSRFETYPVLISEAMFMIYADPESTTDVEKQREAVENSLVEVGRGNTAVTFFQGERKDKIKKAIEDVISEGNLNDLLVNQIKDRFYNDEDKFDDKKLDSYFNSLMNSVGGRKQLALPGVLKDNETNGCFNMPVVNPMTQNQTQFNIPMEMPAIPWATSRVNGLFR